LGIHRNHTLLYIAINSKINTLKVNIDNTAYSTLALN